jgi:hypothetical protein
MDPKTKLLHPNTFIGMSFGHSIRMFSNLKDVIFKHQTHAANFSYGGEIELVATLSKLMNEYPRFDPASRFSKGTFGYKADSLMKCRWHSIDLDHLEAKLGELRMEYKDALANVDQTEALESAQKRQAKAAKARDKAEKKRKIEREEPLVQFISKFVREYGLHEDPLLVIQLFGLANKGDLAKIAVDCQRALSLIRYIDQDRFDAGMRLAQVEEVLTA